MVGPLISSVRLWEFKGIRACEEPIRLSRFTVLIGRNNSGKTSVLEALALLPTYQVGEVRFTPIAWTWEHFMKELHGGLGSMIYGYAGEARIEYVIQGKKVLLEVVGGTIIRPKNSEGAGISRLSMAGLLGVSVDRLKEAIMLLPNDSRFLLDLARKMAEENAWSLVEKSSANTAVVRDLISKAVHDRFTEATVRFNSIVLRKELPDGRVIYVKAADLGDGVERVLIYGLWLETYKPKVVLWDDIEASAHPGLIEAVLEWLASRDWQVVLTTHSYDVLERLVAIEPEGASVVVLKKGADDVLEPRVLSLDELREMLESHVDVRKVVDIL